MYCLIKNKFIQCSKSLFQLARRINRKFPRWRNVVNDLLECIGDRIRWRISCNVQVVVRWMALGVNINSTEEGTAGGSSSVEESNCIGYLLLLLLLKWICIAGWRYSSAWNFHSTTSCMYLYSRHFCFLSDGTMLPFGIFCLIGTWQCYDLCKFWHRIVYQCHSLYVSM